MDDAVFTREEADIAFGLERGWQARCAAMTELYDFTQFRHVSQRTPFERFQVQARQSAIVLDLKDPEFQTFMQFIQPHRAVVEMLNATVLLLLFVYCVDSTSEILRLDLKKTKTFLSKLNTPSTPALLTLITQSGMTASDAIRYVRFYALHMETIPPRLS